MKRIRILFSHMVLFALFIFLSSQQARASEPDELLVFVSIEPQKYLVEGVGGDHVQVEALVPVNQDPHTFTVSPRQIRTLSRAVLYFTIGMPFERVLEEKIRDIQENISFVEMLPHENIHPHDHDDNHEACAEGDPHVWLAPPLLLKMVENVRDTLQRVDPCNKESYSKNAEKLTAEIDRCHSLLSKKLDVFAGRRVYVFHPDLTWFCSTYQLEQMTIQVGGKSPSPRDLQRLIDYAREDKTRFILVQPQFDPRVARTVAGAIGAELVTFNPMEKDIPQNLIRLADVLERGFTQ